KVTLSTSTKPGIIAEPPKLIFLEKNINPGVSLWSISMRRFKFECPLLTQSGHSESQPTLGEVISHL
ncbi:MAG: hypothetical protein ACE1Y1_06920, partial [Nitrosomonadaceae bacterium]